MQPEPPDQLLSEADPTHKGFVKLINVVRPRRRTSWREDHLTYRRFTVAAVVG